MLSGTASVDKYGFHLLVNFVRQVPINVSYSPFLLFLMIIVSSVGWGSNGRLKFINLVNPIFVRLWADGSAWSLILAVPDPLPIAWNVHTYHVLFIYTLRIIRLEAFKSGQVPQGLLAYALSISTGMELYICSG